MSLAVELSRHEKFFDGEPVQSPFIFSSKTYFWIGVGLLLAGLILKSQQSKPVLRITTKSNMEGGLAQGRSLIDLADHHNLPLEDLAKELERGIMVEMEHTNDRRLAREIAMDHLWEDPEYYQKLEAAGL